MRLRSASLCVFALFALLVAAPSANAQKNCPGGGSNQPPGNSEVDQYGEDVPGPCGDQPVGPPNGGGDPDAVPPGTQDELGSLGSDGAAAALLAQSTAPDSGGGGDGLSSGGTAGGEGSGDGSGGSDGRSGGSDLPAAQGDSLFDEIFVAMTGSDDGLGLLLPIILIVALAAAIAYGIHRRTAGG